MSVFYLKKDNSKLGPISREKIIELYRNNKINLHYSVLTEDNPAVELTLAEFCKDDSNNESPIPINDNVVTDNINVAHSATGIQYANQQNNQPSSVVAMPKIQNSQSVEQTSKNAKKKRISINFRRKKNKQQPVEEEKMVFQPAATPPPLPESSEADIVQNTKFNSTTTNDNNMGWQKVFQQEDSEAIVCPHCWNSFPVSDLLFISQDYNDLGDSIAGANARKRFTPESFDNHGHAFDHNGVVCNEKACPICHLKLLDSSLDLDNVFYSIVGAPASGKSYLLASMIQEFRAILSRKFAMTFIDADAKNNMTINNYIQSLFFNADQEKLIALPKTEIQGNLYHQINWQGSLINLPMPFVFTLQSSITARNDKYGFPVNVTFYDNAGEHFQPGMDDYFNPGTKHLGNSEGIVFCFDVSKEVRIANLLTVNDPQLAISDYSNQTVLFSEMAARMRKFRNMSSADRFDKTLIINLVKCDLLKGIFSDEIFNEILYLRDPESKEYQLNFSKILDFSFQARALLQKYCPDFIQVVEGFCSDVYYLPTSSTGNHAEFDAESGTIGIRPKDVKPLYSEIPLMVLLAQQGYIKKYYDLTRKNESGKKHLMLEDYQLTDDTVIFYNELNDSMEQLPKAFFGSSVFDYENDCFIDIPGDFKEFKTEIKTHKSKKKSPNQSNDYKYSFNFNDQEVLDDKISEIDDDDFWND